MAAQGLNASQGGGKDNQQSRSDMAAYIALLRGINVTGRKIIRMKDLRASFEALGFRRVKTYVQSGNVIFEAGKDANLGGKIEKMIQADYGFGVSVFVKTPREMAQVISNNPFPKPEGIEDSRLYVTFLSASAPPTAEKALKGLATEQERFHVAGREVYLCCPNGYGKTKLSNSAIEKKFGVVATTRNWKTVNALLALTQPQGMP
jgi:uncharacterized protein (DUF1697 family)